jgi:integrase
LFALVLQGQIWKILRRIGVQFCTSAVQVMSLHGVFCFSTKNEERKTEPWNRTERKTASACGQAAPGGSVGRAAHREVTLMPVYRDSARGTWFVRYRYTNWKNERKCSTKRGFQKKQQAVQWEREFLLKQAGELDMDFRSFSELYLENVGPRIRETTLMTKQSILESQILPYFQNKSMREITALDVMQWQNTLLQFRDPETQKPYSKSYLKTVHNQLSAIFNHATRYYALSDNPARAVGNMGTAQEIDMHFWTQAEYARFAEAMMDEPLAYYCFEMLYWCGIREGELLALAPEDFDFDAKTVSISKTFHVVHGKEMITPPKTPKSNRKIVMPTFLCSEMQDYFRLVYAKNPTERAFPVSKYYLGHRIHAGAVRQGLQEIRVHDLRHSHVSLLINMGFSAVAIAERMGHKSIDITYRYAHMFPSVQNEMADRLEHLRR